MDEPELNIDEKAQRQYELVEALVGRMQRISAKSTERLQGCRDDRDCWTDKCSHDISTIEDDIRAEMGRTKKRHKSKFLPSDGGVRPSRGGTREKRTRASSSRRPSMKASGTCLRTRARRSGASRL